MANKTINDWDALGTNPAAGDFFAIWDLDAAAQKKVSYTNLIGATITGGGTIATGGFTLTVPATGTAFIATGVAGGQTANGGTAASQNLTLQSTTHATQGYVLLAPSSGNVGIGTATPGSKLHVAEGTSGEQIRIERGTGLVRLIQNNNTDDLIIYNTDASIPMIHIEETGVGILKVNPSSALDVVGSIRGNYDTNTTSYFGRAAIGYGSTSDYASFAHLDQNTATNLALVQSPTGGTILNAATGQSIDFRINNVSQGTLVSTLLSMNDGIRAGFDADKASTLGRASVGWMGTTDVASFAHLDQSSSTNYALKQTAVGATSINAPTGQSITGAINDTTVVTITSTGMGVGNITPSTTFDVNADSIRIVSSQAPASPGATGVQGEIAWGNDTNDYIYVCVATNTWRRAQVSSW